MADLSNELRPMVRLHRDHGQQPLVVEQLDPPRGYRPLAWAGLVANMLVLPLVLAGILISPSWRITNIAVGAGAVLPAAVLGIVACSALLRWRHWGQVLAIIALSLSLAITMTYGVVRIVLEPGLRLPLLLAASPLWLANLAVLLFWCRPAVRRYLR
ncbi:MAG: Hepatitis C virus core protein [Synechococcaceae cyanobacterium]|nr:Hepatitis C virus core protein [Synechococcaceae cyanobacterium]